MPVTIYTGNHYDYHGLLAGENVNGVITLSEFPGSLFFNSTPWFLYITQFYIDKFNDIKINDVVEAFEEVEVARKL